MRWSKRWYDECMGYHEQLSSDSPLYSAKQESKESDYFTLSDPHVQKALIEMWGTGRTHGAEGAPSHNDLAFAWIDSGMAGRYRDYADLNEGQEIDLRDSGALAQLLQELDSETRH
jgi:hypothetical protein